jgi:vacuolar-type H+-ATPase subunit I/STV1
VITIKDEIDQFKRDLRSYTYHQKKVVELEEKLEELATRMQGLSSPAFKEVVYENTSNPYSDNRLQLMDEEEILIKERNVHFREMKRLDDALALLDEDKQQILRDIYVKRKNIDYVASKNYCSIRKVKYDVNAMIKWVIVRSKELEELNKLHKKTQA